MTNINEVMERLEKAATDCLHGDPWYTEGDLVSSQNVSLPQDRALIAAANPQAILALLSYTKQCREALEVCGSLVKTSEKVRAVLASEPAVQGPAFRDLGITFVSDLNDARQALSTQPGERE